MSRIIKPSDKETFDSAKKFVKETFAVNERPDKNDSGRAKSHRAKENGPNPKRKMEKPDPNDLIRESRRKAEQIVREAEQRAIHIREEAREQGRAEGLEEVRKKTEEQFKESSLTLNSFIEQMKARESDLMQLLTPRLANLSADLAEKIIHREIEKDSSVVTLQAEQAISKILERDKLIIRVNPVDVVYYVNFVYNALGAGPCDPCE